MRTENSRQRPIKKEAQAQAGPSHSLNAIVAALCAWFIWFFSGPIYSLLARTIYADYICHWIYGGEGWIAWGREFIHCTIPAEHVGHYAYNYGELVMGGLSFGLSYYVTHRLQRIYNRVENIAHEGASLIRAEINASDLMAELRAVQNRIDALHLHAELGEVGLSQNPVLTRSRTRASSLDEIPSIAVSSTTNNPAQRFDQRKK